MTALAFKECDTCRAKPGSPKLCSGCLHNRAVIERLRSRDETQPVASNLTSIPMEARSLLRQAPCPECGKPGYGSDTGSCAWCDQRDKVCQAILDMPADETNGCESIIREWRAAVRDMETSHMETKLAAQRRVVAAERKLIAWADSSPLEPTPEPAKPWKRGANPVGTHKQGYAPFSYSRIVEIFGEPDHIGTEEGDRCAFDWYIEFADGTVATIYDYKASSLYGDGDDAPTPEEMKKSFTDWHIGGQTPKAVELVLNALKATAPRTIFEADVAPGGWAYPSTGPSPCQGIAKDGRDCALTMQHEGECSPENGEG